MIEVKDENRLKIVVVSINNQFNGGERVDYDLVSAYTHQYGGFIFFDCSYTTGEVFVSGSAAKEKLRIDLQKFAYSDGMIY